jgi:SAM-dependent methyltransferase
MIKPSICKKMDFHEPWYAEWSSVFGGPVLDRPEAYQRKAWEWAAILEALRSRGKLKMGNKGLGFAVGQEPLTSVFARYGIEVLASDLHHERQTGDWVSNNQFADSLEHLWKPLIVERELFDANVSFQPIDMSETENLPSDTYDFIWSSCALEHIGDLDDGLNFVVNTMRLLKPGGVAVHTTEYNIASNDDTITSGNMCIYRKRDLEKLDSMLRKLRCGMEQMDYNLGHHPDDLNYDEEPYGQNGYTHIKLKLLGHISTSCLIIAHKG